MFDSRKPVQNVESRRAQIMDKIHRTYADIERKQQQLQNGTLQQCEHRNVLLVGLSKSGKSTLTKVLIDPRHVPDELSLRTSSAIVPSCDRNVCPDSTQISFTVVELPEKMIDLKSNLTKINEECTQLAVNYFHLICLCTSLDTGINGQDIRSFERLLDHFGKETISHNLCMIITRCESKNDEQRKQMCDELMNDTDFTKITRWLGRGIYFSGALNRDDWNKGNDALYDQFETVYNYRKDLLALIESDIQPFYLQPIQSKLKMTPPPRIIE